MKTFIISRLAGKAQVPIQTIRYYERIGLLSTPQRRSSGYREYTEEDVKRIRFIKKAQNLGFTLQEIEELLNLRVDPKTNCEEMDQRTREKIQKIEKKIQDLQQIKKALQRLIQICETSPSEQCLILDFLENPEEKI